MNQDLLKRLVIALPLVRSWATELQVSHLPRSERTAERPFPRLAAYFTRELLDTARFVVVRDIPFPPVATFGVPEFEALAAPGMAGITFGSLYFVRDGFDVEALHAHELAHVIQWSALGPDGFLLAYAVGILQHGYAASPLEMMATSVQRRLEDGGVPADGVVDLEVASHAERALRDVRAVFQRNSLAM